MFVLTDLLTTAHLFFIPLINNPSLQCIIPQAVHTV